MSGLASHLTDVTAPGWNANTAHTCGKPGAHPAAGFGRRAEVRVALAARQGYENVSITCPAPCDHDTPRERHAVAPLGLAHG